MVKEQMEKEMSVKVLTFSASLHVHSSTVTFSLLPPTNVSFTNSAPKAKPNTASVSVIQLCHFSSLPVSPGEIPN